MMPTISVDGMAHGGAVFSSAFLTARAVKTFSPLRMGHLLTATGRRLQLPTTMAGLALRRPSHSPVST
jgi:hypothetical protein